MLIDVNKWIDKNGSFDEAGGAVSNLFDSYTYDVKNTDVDKFKMSDVMNVYRIINL